MYLKLLINYYLQLDSQVVIKLQVKKFEKRVKCVKNKTKKVVRNSKAKVVKRGI